MGEQMPADLSAIAERVAHAGRAALRTGPLGPLLELTVAGARAAIALRGAQLVSWRPQGHDEVIWMSPASPSRLVGKALRGGTPICWPWFGPDPECRGRPAHGFVRGTDWTLEHTDVTDETTLAAFCYRTTPADHALWPHAASARAVFVLDAKTLAITLTTVNEGQAPFVLTEALHTYFAVADIGSTAVHGLDGVAYLDKVGDEARRRQAGAVTFAGEVDRIYLDPPASLAIVDAGNGRTIRVASRGSRSVVVWNPWNEKAARLGDMGADGFRRMVCVETANAGDDVVTLAAGDRHVLAALYSLEPMR